MRTLTCFQSEDENTMDQNDAMDTDEPSSNISKPKQNDDDLAEYNLDDYDEEDSMPGSIGIYFAMWLI